MINVSEIRAGAGRVYKLAPSPATFLTLSWAALVSIDELLASWDKCPGATQVETIAWKKSAIAYRNALVKARDTARAVIDHAATGNPDWQQALEKGSAYAVELGRFFNGPQALSGGWADAANALEEIGCKPPPGPWEKTASSLGAGAEWLTYLVAPWTETTTTAIKYVVEKGGDLEAMGEDAQNAVNTYFKTPAEYLAKAVQGISMLVVAGVALWFGWPIVAPLFGLAAAKTGER